MLSKYWDYKKKKLPKVVRFCTCLPAGKVCKIGTKGTAAVLVNPGGATISTKLIRLGEMGFFIVIT